MQLLMFINKRIGFLIFCLLVLLCKDYASAKGTIKTSLDPERYVCVKTSNPVTIDGVIDANEWKNTPWSIDFVNIEGKNKPQPEFATKMKLLWDDDYLYVAAHFIEPHVWAKLTRHDTILYYDDVFEVFIDPDGDTHNYIEFQINALGTTWDLMMNKPYRDGGQAENNYEISGLKQAVHVNGTLNDPTDIDKGWSIELAIPWKAMPAVNGVSEPPKQGSRWRMNFSRVDWMMEVANGEYIKLKDENGNNLSERYWVWSPHGEVALHQPEKWGYVHFLNQLNR